MEIEDCCYNSLNSVITTTDPNIAFVGADVVIILGGYPRTPGMERKDLIAVNAEGMKLQADALNKHASPDCKVVVIANPCNTNCLVAMKIASKIPPQNFSCLTRLDQERLTSFIRGKVNESSERLKITGAHIKDVIIWGNHSATQVPDVSNISVRTENNEWVAISSMVDREWLYDTLIPAVQKRGAEIIKYSGASSALSAANAIAKHVKDILAPNEDENVFSVGISSNGNPYGIPDGLCFSFPCHWKNGVLEIAPGFNINEQIRAMLDKTVEELIAERTDAEAIVGPLV